MEALRDRDISESRLDKSPVIRQNATMSMKPARTTPPAAPTKVRPAAQITRRATARSMANVGELRELFWHNVVRELLTNLSMLHAQKSASSTAASDEPQEDLFDGRLAIITTNGGRIAIGAITPMFACGLNGTEADKELSMDVECTVFQIETPEGEVFTLPVHEIRSFHALTAALIERIKAASGTGEDKDGSEGGHMPFGFAAFTSMAHSQKQEALEIKTIVGPDLDPVP